MENVNIILAANILKYRKKSPYEDDFLSVGKTCFMEDTASGVLFASVLAFAAWSSVGAGAHDSPFALWIFLVVEAPPPTVRRRACESSLLRSKCKYPGAK